MEKKLTKKQKEQNRGIKLSPPWRRGGIINPSFIVAVVPDMDRWNDGLQVPSGLYSEETLKLAKQARAENGIPFLSDVFGDFLEPKQKRTGEMKRIGDILPKT